MTIRTPLGSSNTNVDNDFWDKTRDIFINHCRCYKFNVDSGYVDFVKYTEVAVYLKDTEKYFDQVEA